MNISQDILWKGIIEDMCYEFILYFFSDAENLIDFTRGIEFLDKELSQLFNDSNIGHRFVDKLIKVYSLSGDENWILVHVEIQGYSDKNFEKRMFTYFYRIFDKYQMPITALAIFTDDDPDYLPNKFKMDFLGTGIQYHFNVFKVTQQKEKQLRQSQNPFAEIILMSLLRIKNKKSTDDKLLSIKKSIVKNMKGKSYSNETIRSLLEFMGAILNFENPKYVHTFVTEITEFYPNIQIMGLSELVLQEVKRQAIEEGMEKGMELGAKGELMTVILKLVRKGLSDQKIAELLELNIEDVNAVRIKYYS